MSTGILCNGDMMTNDEVVSFAKRAEAAGVDTIWLPELFGRDPFVTSAVVLGATTTVRVGTAIANVYARDAQATKAAAHSLADSYGDRFDLGLGLSNKVANEPRGHDWQPPTEKLTRFIDLYDNAPLMFPQSGKVDRYLAAHGPKLMALAADRLDGAFSYLQTVAYNAEAKALLGGKRLHVMQQCVFIEDPDHARAIARKAIGVYLPLENYHRAWRARGFDDVQFANGGSDDFIDALIAWGTADRIGERCSEQRAHGADHVIVIPIKIDLKSDAGWARIEQLTTS